MTERPRRRVSAAAKPICRFRGIWWLQLRSKAAA